MQKCGLDPNKIPTTWDEYFAAGDTIVQNCKDVYLGTTMGYNAEDLMTAGVKSFMNDDHSKYTFNDEAGVKQISRFVELYKKGGIPPEALDSSWSQAADLFQRGDVAIDFARFVTNEKNQIEFDKKASVFPSAKGGLDDDYYKSIDESTLEGKALKITLDQVKDGYGSRPAEFTDNNGYKNFQQQIALAMQGKQTAKEALDKSVEFANEKLAQ